MIVLSIAHSTKDPGNTHCGLVEHQISEVMSDACATMLRAHGVETLLLAPSALPYPDDLKDKVRQINELKPQLALEIHTNAVDDTAPNYSEVIYEPGSVEAKLAASHISGVLRDALGQAHHMWPAKGAVEAERNLYFLQKTICPALIVEPLFQSNPEQAAWLKTQGAPETIGAIVADGILNYLKGG